MKIILLVLLMILICFLIGRCLIPAKSKIINPIAIQIGYAYLLISFYIFFLVLKSPLYSTALVFSIPIFLSFFKARSLLSYIQFYNLRFTNIKDEHYFLFFSIAIILTIASWPYIQNGIGNYWHIGNMDMEDGVMGRDAYLKGLIFNDVSNAIFTWDQERYPTKDSPYFLWYAGDEIRLQYSNLAFWSFLMGIKTGLDIVYLNLLLNLSMLVMGVFTLSKRIFSFSNIQASISSIACGAASFYLGTYWAGHIGSNMYDALFPAIIFLFFIPNSREHLKALLPAFLLLTLALSYTYHQALILGLGYLLGYKLLSSPFFSKTFYKYYLGRDTETVTKWIIRFAFTIALLLLLITLWRHTESYRLQSFFNYRAWGVVNYFQIIPIFLGILTYPFSTIITAKGHLATYIGIAYSLIITIAIFSYKGRNHLFLKLFLIMWLLGIAFFYSFIQDSYYIYKYLYTHQFILILGFSCAVFSSKSKLLKLAALILFSINIASDLEVGRAISKLEINQDSKLYEEVLSFDREKLSLTYLDLGISERMVVRQILKREGIEPKTTLPESEYVAVHKGTLGEITGEQLGEIVFQTNKLDIRRSPKNNILTFKTTFSEPEFSSIPHSLRWIKDGNDDYLALSISKIDLLENPQIKYLRFCTEKGPSLSRNATLKVIDSEKNVLKEISLGSRGCSWIPASQIIEARQPIIFKTGERGSSLPFPEDRKLMYRITLLGWTDRINDPNSEKYIGIKH